MKKSDREMFAEAQRLIREGDVEGLSEFLNMRCMCSAKIDKDAVLDGSACPLHGKNHLKRD